MMASNKLINASHWAMLQHEHFIIYSANQELLSQLKTQRNITQFWRNTYIPFAAIIINTQNQQVTAVRDHFGVEPFYYTQYHGKFIFGSLLPDLLKWLPVKPQWNTGVPLENLFKHVFEGQEIYNDETYYQSIHRVTPGHELHLEWIPNAIKIQKIN